MEGLVRVVPTPLIYGTEVRLLFKASPTIVSPTVLQRDFRKQLFEPGDFQVRGSHVFHDDHIPWERRNCPCVFRRDLVSEPLKAIA
jgi:hypothetical protein